MRKAILIFTLLFAAITGSVLQSGSAQEQHLLLRQPTISRTHIVFSYAGDLWIVARAGGEASRLTNGVGREATPIFSPDGSTIAFTGEYDGNVDLYTIPATGGVPKRITYYPGTDALCNWSPDGKQLLFISDRASESRRFLKLFTTPVAGGLATEVPLPMGHEGAFSPDGQRLAQAAALPLVQTLEQVIAVVRPGEQQLAEAKTRTAETEKQIESVEHLVAEVNAAEQLAKEPPAPQGTFRSTGMLVRFVGASRWNLSDFGKVDAFYRLRFSKPLPVSAFGQTDTHNRLGFDHSNALDVAVHPDSAEGQALIEFLQRQGISFIAIRGAIPGSATGAHIHIGSPSRRIFVQQ